MKKQRKAKFNHF